MTTATSSVGVDTKREQLQSLMAFLKNFMEEMSTEIDHSYALLQAGELTDFSRQLEANINKPLPGLVDVSLLFDERIKNILDSVVNAFFRKHVKHIESVFKEKNETNELFYYIVLKEDKTEDRDLIFSFFNKYHRFKAAYKFPIYFQFVPLDLKSKIKHNERVALD